MVNVHPTFRKPLKVGATLSLVVQARVGQPAWITSFVTKSEQMELINFKFSFRDVECNLSKPISEDCHEIMKVWPENTRDFSAFMVP